jgi:hypothetical protein
MFHGRLHPCPGPATEIQYPLIVENTNIGRSVLPNGILKDTIQAARYCVSSFTFAAVRNIFLAV